VLVIEVRFLAGRFHATPWGRSVNEGQVEWPPAPWRLARGLIAVWHRTTPTASPSETATMERLVAALATPPRFRLPPASRAHTRHYVPDFQGDTSKILDAFVVVDPSAPVRFVWDSVTLLNDEAALLSSLLRELPYLGRAESWVEARVGTIDDGPSSAEPVTGPFDSDDDLVRVLCPMSPTAYAAWKSGREAADPKPARSKKARAPVPATLLEALQASTEELQKAGWSHAPGAVWVPYRLRADAFSTTAPRARSGADTPLAPTIARFAVAGAVRPRITDALFLAERQIRPALMKISDGLPVFSGKDEAGQPRAGNAHAYILCEALGGPGDAGRVTHVTVFARMGFDDAARDALHRLRRVWGSGGHDLQTVLLGLGTPRDHAGSPRVGGSPLCGESRRWVSYTPFVATRHPKFRADGSVRKVEDGWSVGSPEHDLRRLLLEDGYPTPTSIERIQPDVSSDVPVSSWLSFRTRRTQGEGRRASSPPLGFRVVFPVPVQGPLALGYGAHFGLGAFRPDPSG